MVPTLRQLHNGMRKKKFKKLKAPAFDKAPHAKGVIYQIATMSPRKPNSARRTFAKLLISKNRRRVFAKIPGIGPHYLQPHSVVLVRGHGPKDSPGINYYLIRGKYDFSKQELYGRRQKRSKYSVKKYS